MERDARQQPGNVYLGLGANLGDREANLKSALTRLAEGVTVEAVSSFYETEPVGFKDQPWFLNAVCRGRTYLEPLDLFRFVKGVEIELGRRPDKRNYPRVIDIDILFYGDLVLQTPELTIPHPRLAKRAFVLVPLAEIAPDLVHPSLGQTVAELLAGLQEPETVSRRK